ncbi:hypothetical protein ACN47E_003269 [Coniothyrium glycines]
MMATPANSKPRQRAWKPKARTGCKTCKIRKVKCDEEKPSCKRCTSTGRTCDGYDTSFRPPAPSQPSRSPKYLSPGQLSARSSAERSPSPAYLVPALRLNTVEERESFEFFTLHAVTSLRGFLDSSFWQREVLQAVHQEPAIQHCVVALGAMHRRFHQGHGSHLIEKDMSDKYLQFALRQSNQAIQDLVKSQSLRGKVSGADRVTIMTCSVLFGSMSCLQGHNKDAFEHLKSGIRMLNEMENEVIENHPVDIESLRSLFVGLDMQARSIMSARDSQTWVARPRKKSSTKLDCTELNMASLLTMLRYTECLLNDVHNFFQDSISRAVEDGYNIYLEYNNLIKRHRRGASAFEVLSNKALANNNEFSQPLSALRLLQCMAEFLLRFPRADVLGRFHLVSNFKFENDFEQPFDPAAQCFDMFELATRLLPISSSAAPVFTTTIGPIAALWLVAIKAPSTCAALRKRAVKLMLSHPRREGFWDGMVAGQLAQEALKLEEESMQAEFGLLDISDCDLVIPDDLRIGVVRISYDGVDDRKARVEFCNSRDVAAGTPGRIRTVSW